MNKLKTSILAIGLSTSVASNAALVFEFDVGPNYNQAFIASNVQTDAETGVSYKLRATTPTAGRSLAQQPGNQGLGVGAAGGANPWWIGDGEAINFELRVWLGNAMSEETVDFSLDSFDATSFKIAYGERAYITMNGNDYAIGGNDASQAGSKTIDTSNALGSNPAFPNNRGAQFSWQDEVASNFTLTGGDMPGSVLPNGTIDTKYRIELVRLELAPAAAPVPVPAAAWLFGSALAGLTLARRK